MEGAPAFEEDNDLSFEGSTSSFPSPLIMSPPGHQGGYDLEQRRQEEKEQLSQSFIFRPDSDAALNYNTNATTRGDAQAYVELNELVGGVWQETGRWAGYEESYSPASRKWGSSHISYLTFKSLIQLRKAMTSGAIILDVDEGSLSGVLEKMVDELQNKGEIRPNDRDPLLGALRQRRSQAGPSTVGGDIEMQTFSVTKQRDNAEAVEASVVLSGAIETLQKPAVAFARLRDSAVMDSVLESAIPVRFIFLLVGPSQSGIDFHESGRAMATLMADWVFSLEAYLAQSDKEITNAIADFMDCSIVIPPTNIQDEAMLQPIIDFQQKMLQDRLRPSDARIFFGQRALAPSLPAGPVEDPLARTGMPFGGMIKDIKRRYRHYISDFTDAINAQVLAAVIFIYFAALSPAITFGGLLADKTQHMMGVSELMISTCVQGVIFCLLAAQPVLVIGFTGPLLVFEEAFFQFCTTQGLEYIVGRIWVGMWLIVIVVIIVAVEGSFLVKFISRFTQEIFSILISLIFIYETFAKLGRIFATHPLVLNYDHLNASADDPFEMILELRNVTHDGKNYTLQHHHRERAYPNTALLSMCLMFGCFFIAFFLRQFKNGVYFPGPLRRMIGDFGVPIAIFFMIAVDISIEDAYTQKLVVPKGLTVSNTTARGWMINPMGEKKPFPVWMMVASLGPALLVFILIFMESQITTLIVSKPERKMIKGSGFHFDLFLLVAMGGAASIFGVPWLSAATVRSVTHANALTVMTKGPKPEIEKVLEQRISGILVAILVGLSILMEPVLKMIPMTALFGIFLYMGITSLNGIQLWDRMLLLIVPKKYHPNLAYATKVATMRMHVFTLIQVICLAVLWAVKSSRASLALPFILILTIPLRMAMTGTLFTANEMKCLDAEDANVVLEEEPGEDAYDESPLP